MATFVRMRSQLMIGRLFEGMLSRKGNNGLWYYTDSSKFKDKFSHLKQEFQISCRNDQGTCRQPVIAKIIGCSGSLQGGLSPQDPHERTFQEFHRDSRCIQHNFPVFFVLLISVFLKSGTLKRAFPYPH